MDSRKESRAGEPATKGKAAGSVNDIPEMRQAFAGLKQRPLSITYSIGSADHRSPSRQ